MEERWRRGGIEVEERWRRGGGEERRWKNLRLRPTEI